MHKLSGMDATFLYMETNETPMHISGLMVCEPPQNGENPFEALKSQIAERLHEIPSFHRKLRHTPFYIDHPVWINADYIDMEYHIKHARLPEPGTVEQLRTLVQGLHAVTLDRDRPLWQFYVIEGVEDEAFGIKKGSFAIYTKAHHASLDGGGGISAMDIVSDREPTPRPPLPKSRIALYDEDPGMFELLGNSYGRFVQQYVDMVTNLPAYTKALGRLAKVTLADARGMLKNVKLAPKTRFNVRIQKQRAFGAQTLNLYDVIGVAKMSDTSLNDVVLSICGGALRRYLDRHNELPEKSLVAGVPVSLRELGDTSNNNQVAGITCDVGTDIQDPLQRLRFVNEYAIKKKMQLGAVKDVVPTDYSILGAPMIVSSFAKLSSRTDLMSTIPMPLNVLISNVPGPRRDVYFAGSKVLCMFPVSIPTHGVALNITLQSYTDRIDFGLIACKKAVPDVQDIADDIIEEFKLLKAAVEKAAAGQTQSKPKSRQSKTALQAKAEKEAKAKAKAKTAARATAKKSAKAAPKTKAAETPKPTAKAKPAAKAAVKAKTTAKTKAPAEKTSTKPEEKKAS